MEPIKTDNPSRISCKPSQIDIAPTIAEALGIRMPDMDGMPIEMEGVGGIEKSFTGAAIIIVDSLGYDLYRHLEKDLSILPALASRGKLFSAQAVEGHTSPAIASILSGLRPENHQIWNTEDAKGSKLKSLPEAASSQGISTAVVMEEGGAEVYTGLIDFVGGVDRTLNPDEFDRQIRKKSVEAVQSGARLIVSYFIGIDKAAHRGLGMKGMKAALGEIDIHIGAIQEALGTHALVIVCGDHPVHAGELKRTRPPYCVALIVAPSWS